MKFNSQHKITLLILLVTQISFAQKKDENIGTEVVNVVKPYSPTVSDAFKVKETPSLDDNETNRKEEIKYQIFSFPVASTFTPSKGKAASVDKAKQEKLYQNYATLGIGNYMTANAELFVSHELDKYQYVGGMFRHQSSQGGIKNVAMEDGYSDSSLDVMYAYNRKSTKWTADAGYKKETYNWYGFPFEIPAIFNSFLGNINPKHDYSTIKIGSELTISDSFFDKAKVNFTSFTDNYSSKENRFVIQPSFTFEFDDTAVKAKFGVDYLNSSFETSYLTAPAAAGVPTNNERSNLIFSANPSYTILKDDLSVELGAEVVYYSKVKDTYAGIKNGSDSDFFIYPKINASYKVVGDLMVFFAGAEGGLKQNSYADFASVNKFLSPTLLIQPTDAQYDIYAGLKGKLANSLAYNVKGSYKAERNKALYKMNPFAIATLENYSYGNSFDVAYDDVKTISVFGELKADINKNITLGVNAEYNNYNTDVELSAWNLPEIKATFTTDFNIGQKWYAGTQLYYVGERKDFFFNPLSLSTNTTQSLDAYFDINAHVGYKYNARLTAFLKGNNLANQNYNRWLNYPVQGAQVILGASYKFDF